MTIGGYSINGYLLLFYKWLLVVILLMIISGYSINGYYFSTYRSRSRKNYVDFIFNGKMIWKFQAHELMKHIVYNIWKSIIEK